MEPRPMQQLVPQKNYMQLIRYMHKTYGVGILPAPTYRETAEILTNEVGWFVDPNNLNTAHYRWKKNHK